MSWRRVPNPTRMENQGLQAGEHRSPAQVLRILGRAGVDSAGCYAVPGSASRGPRLRLTPRQPPPHRQMPHPCTFSTPPQAGIAQSTTPRPSHSRRFASGPSIPPLTHSPPAGEPAVRSPLPPPCAHPVEQMRSYPWACQPWTPSAALFSGIMAI